ncbi:HET-domain-containing protein [Xylariaceae sp. AK1471]|nr:HET-domain-containing protein [Xylariaceae sp. AK1471]
MAESNDISCFTDDATIALKRRLAAGHYSSAHSCRHCERFVVAETLPRGDQEAFFFQALIPIDEIHRLAADGCRWFSLFSNKLKCDAGIDEETFTFWEFFRWREPVPPDAVPEGSVLISMRYKIWEHVIDIKAGFSDGESLHMVSFDGFKQPDVNTYPGSRSLGSPINTNPASDESIQLIRSWLGACSVKHNCGIQHLPPSLPTFLLALGKECVRLMDTAGKPRARYVALSYCWGDKEQKTLLLGRNKQQLLGDIALEHLDTTIQEAIHITRQIGFQYLWIDALCIAQDDEKTKLLEIARMDEIYRNATLTLIPSRAADVQEGFLSKREIAGSSQPHLIFELPYFDKNSPVQDRTIILVPKETLRGEMLGGTAEIWSLRAWTLQEGIISPRRLQFGSEQTTWTCRHAATQYRDSDGWLSTGHEEKSVLNAGYTVRNQASQIMDRGGARYPSKQVLRIWDEIRTEFSGRGIKYQDDRLPAISRIAKGFAQVLNDDYICGLWKARLHHDLLWSRIDYKDRSKVASGFQPSWSWASSRRPIRQPYTEVFKDSDFEVVKYSVVPKHGGDEYGAIESASLRIRALIASVPEAIINDHRADLIGLSTCLQISRSDYTRRTYGQFSPSLKGRLLAGNKRQKASRVNDLSSMMILTDIVVDSPEIVPRDEGYRSPRDKLVDLSLLIVGHRQSPNKTFGGPCGLLITKEENGTYRRIGFFETGNLWGRDEDHYWGKWTYPHPLDKEYRSRVLYLWGGETGIREVTLV